MSREMVPIQRIRLSAQGSTLCRSCAFGALSKCIFQSTHANHDAKRALYERLILSICCLAAEYGCESWCLKETLCNELRKFHARCVRTMNRTNLHHTWIHHISTKNLETELGLDPKNNYIARRQLRWLGHVSCMPFDRLPRRILSSWLPFSRCRDAAKMTDGRTIGAVLEDNVSHTHGIYPCTPSLFVLLSLFPFSFW